MAPQTSIVVLHQSIIQHFEIGQDYVWWSLKYLIPVFNANQSNTTKAITSRVSQGHSASADLVTVLVRTDITIDFEKQIRE